MFGNRASNGESGGSVSASTAMDVGIARSALVQTRQQSAVGTRCWYITILFVALLANAGLLVAQQVSFRLLAPLVGSSVETWSTVIGVFLFGIALGNWLGARLDRRIPAPHLLGAALVSGAAAIWLMPLIANALGSAVWFQWLPLPMQILLAAVATCLLPGTCLSLSTPPSISSITGRSGSSGWNSGLVFACGSMGSLAGNYLTGFVLLAMLGNSNVLGWTAIALMLLAGFTILSGRLWFHPGDQAAMRRLRPVQAGPIAKTASGTGVQAASIPVWAVICVLGCGFSCGALESAAFRILAPLVGVSMFLSASVVGAVLAGMSIGNAMGGWMATRWGKPGLLRWSLIASAATILMIPLLWNAISQFMLFESFGLVAKSVIWSLTLFFLPSLALGTITPQVIRLNVRTTGDTGFVAGRLYAWSTVGCVAGILLAAWVLVSGIGAVRTGILCGLVPALFATMLLPRAVSGTAAWKEASQRWSVGIALAGMVLLLMFPSPYDCESRYFSITIREAVEDGRPVSKLVLDRLVHSAIDVNDPGYLHYAHEYVQGDLVRAVSATARAEGRQPRILIIGGGGYSFPRWVETRDDLQDVHVDVVEIDPAVTEIAHQKLGLPRDTRIVSWHLDGRQYVKSAPQGLYDLVIQDAVNDFSVPYHLMTREYKQRVRELLTPDGVYLLTVIDDLENGRFLASSIRTIEAAFGKSQLMLPQQSKNIQGRRVFVIGGRNETAPVKMASTGGNEGWWTARTEGYVIPRSQIDDLLSRCGENSPVLTDDFAPVDILMISHFLGESH